MTSENKSSSSTAMIVASNGPIEPKLSAVIDSFASHIESLAETIPLHAIVTQAIAHDSAKKLNDFLDEKCTPSTDSTGKQLFSVPQHAFHEYRKLKRHADIARHSRKIVPRSLFVSLVSQYDAYVGRLVRSLLLLKPDVLHGSERSISYVDLISFGSLDAARDYVIEKEIETLLRGSHSDQFDWLEKKFSIELRKGLEVWPRFIEVTERRNLYVHCDGVVSSQYLVNCKLNNAELPPETKIGHELQITPKYFAEAAEAILEIGVKLGHVLWRKIRHDQRAEADSHLSLIGYELIVSRRHRLALKFLELCEVCGKKYSSDESRRRFLINRCQAYKWMGNNEKCLELLANEDWSSCSDVFQLAVATLRDEFDEAVKIMIRIGKSSSPDQSDYRDWPLFQEFRKSDAFASAYKEIFRMAFVPAEVVLKSELKE